MRAIITGIGLLACSCGRAPEPASDATTRAFAGSVATLPAPDLPDSVASDWIVLAGRGFRMRYPGDASLDAGEPDHGGKPGTVILGPRVHVAVDPDVGPSEGPAYRLVVSTVDNPAGLSVDQWVDSLMRQQNTAERDSIVYLVLTDTLRLTRARALELSPFCGDCLPYDVYFARGRQVVVVSYTLSISYPGDPMRQRRLYRLILDTFEWTN